MKNKNMKTWFLNYGIVFVLFILILVFGIGSKNFLRVSTIFTILKQISITGIISIGMAFVIMTGGIDLSVGSIAGVTAVTAAILMTKNYPIFVACVLSLILATIYGLFNGLLITKINMPPLIATLGMMTALRGLAFIITDGLPVFGFNKVFGNFAKGQLWVVPYPVLLLLAIFLINLFLLDMTPVGRYIYGVGGNAEASRLSGIDVTKVKIFAYSLNGLLSGIAGLVLLSRTSSGQPSAGNGYEMNAITSVVLGGVNLNGGEGKLPLVLVGAMIMGVLSTGMLMLNINDYVQQLVEGLVLLGAVAFSNLSLRLRVRIETHG